MNKIKKITIIAGGKIKNKIFHRLVLSGSDLIICADGGANWSDFLGIIPDFVVGDLDSIKKNVLKKMKNNCKTKIIYDPDQNKTDLELAIILAEKFKPKELLIIGAISEKMDHTLANIFCLNKINKNIKAKIIDDKNEIELVSKKWKTIGKKNDIVSILPLTPVEGLSYRGLKWNLKNYSVDFGWLGVRNRMTKNKASVKLDKGKILVIKDI